MRSVDHGRRTAFGPSVSRFQEWPRLFRSRLGARFMLRPLRAIEQEGDTVVTLPNQRMKLSRRGGRLMGKRSVLIAAAPTRSLCAIR